VLWDETVALLNKEMAKPNKHNRCLLNANGEPLYRNEKGQTKYDAIDNSYAALCKKNGIRIGFKQFRKMGATAIEKISGGRKQAVRLYRAATIEGGDDVYVKEAFENLTPVLQKWGKELRKDKVLK
jgi:hypothetical protein